MIAIKNIKVVGGGGVFFADVHYAKDKAQAHAALYSDSTGTWRIQNDGGVSPINDEVRLYLEANKMRDLYNNVCYPPCITGDMKLLNDSSPEQVAQLDCEPLVPYTYLTWKPGNTSLEFAKWLLGEQSFLTAGGEMYSEGIYWVCINDVAVDEGSLPPKR